MTSSFWRHKNVVLLGGASLIGSHLAEALLPLAGRVSIADDFSSGSMENVPADVVFSAVDLRNYDNVREVIRKGDIVFHLAAQHGGRGYVASHKTELYNNLELDTTIFRACSDAHVEKVIFSSSACAYPVDLQTRSSDLVYLAEDMIDYNNIRQADGAYGTEKLLGEIMLDAYIERGDFMGCSTRSFTVYGPLMGETHAIAAFIAKTMLKPSVFEIWGDGKQVRNWTHVEDNVAGALLAAEHLDRGVVNIGIEERLTPNDAVEVIWDYMGWHPSEVHYLPDKPVGPRNRVADATKLKSLGWLPHYSFEEGLRMTIDWYTETHSVEELKQDLERRLTER